MLQLGVWPPPPLDGLPDDLLMMDLPPLGLLGSLARSAELCRAWLRLPRLGRELGESRAIWRMYSVFLIWLYCDNWEEGWAETVEFVLRNRY